MTEHFPGAGKKVLGEPVWPEAPCCAPDYPGGCACGPAERALRAWRAQRPMPAMTADQKAWCLAEIAKVEGYQATYYADQGDKAIAGGVLDAWLDYCRDKGLLP